MLRDVLIQQGLSHREAEVAELVAEGLPNRAVANRLFVTEKTVKFHLTNIYKKMKVKSRAQLIVWCVPHFNFVEKRVNQVIENQGTHKSPQNETGFSISSIPAGSSTVSQSQDVVITPLKTEDTDGNDV